MRRNLLRSLFLFMLSWLSLVGVSQTAPFTESFNTTSIPTGWTNTSSSTSANAQWKFSGTPGNPSMSGSAYNPPVILDHTGNNGSIAWSDGSSPAVADCGLMTDSIDISALTSLYLEFWYYSNNVTNAGDNNTLYVNFYDGTQWNDSIWGFAGDVTVWQYAGIDLSSYTTSGKVMFEFILDQTTSNTAFYNDVLLDDISVKNAPACPLPINLASSNITATSATLSWSSVSAATGYNVLVGTAGFDPSTATAQTTTVDSINVTNLMSATNYEYYVVANCGTNGFSDTTGPASFQTSCVTYSMPFSEDFTTWPPTCFDITNTGALVWDHNSAGHAQARFWNFSSGTAFLTTPPIDITQVARLKFKWAHLYSASYPFDQMVVRAQVVGTTTWDTLADFIGPVDFNTPASNNTTPPSSLSDFASEIFYLDSATYYGQEIIVQFAAITDFGPNLYLDDVVIEAVPACPEPTQIAVSNVGASTADVAWTSTGSKFILEYGPCGFNQGTGTFDTVYTSNATLTGLFSNTDYEVYIQTDCSAGGNGISVWSQSSCFRTECAAQATPLSEGFESAPAGSFSNWTTPDCWKYEKAQHGSSATGSYAYVYNLASVARTGTQTYRMYRSGFSGQGDTSAFVSPQIDSMDVNYKHITFWARNQYSGTFYNTDFVVGTVSSPGDLSSLVILDTVTMNSTTYSYFDIYIDPANGYNGTHKYIVIADLVATTSTSTFIIDDITIDDIPQCTPSTGLAVSNITNNSALASWEPGDGAAFDIEYGITGFTQGTGAPLITGIVDSSYTMMGLQGNTCYDVYVRDSCSGSKSPWFGPITFCTPCDPQNIPLDEDFENVAGPGNTQNPSTPDCWTYWRNHTNFSPYGYTDGSTFTQPNGTYQWRFYSFSEIDTAALISPALSGLSNGDKMVKFKNKAYYTSTAYTGIALEVGTSPDYNTIRNATAIDTVYGDYGQAYINDFQVFLDSNSGYNGTDQYIYFRPIFKNSTYYAYNFIDDIEIQDIPACTPPWKVKVSNVGATTADVSWSTLSTGDFRVEYGPVGFTPATGQGTVVSNTSSVTSLTNLTPNTFYELYVADNCDTSLAGHTGPILFRTECTSQLSGTYTVGGATADFPDLDSAMFVLSGCGVSGPVTFNVAAGTDSTTIALGVINGSDSVNTVTIKGAGINSTTVYINSSVGAGIDLDGSDYVTFEDMTIDGSNTQRVVWLHNRADHITFNNCNIMGTSANTSSLTGVIIASGSPTSALSSGENANYLTVTNCEISGGYYGITNYGSGIGNYSVGLHIENNVFHDVHYYAMRIFYMDQVDIIGNEASDFTNTFNISGYFWYLDNFNIEKNEFINDGYTMYVYRPNYQDSPSSRSRIVNNFFSTLGTTYAVYGSTWNYVDYFHNSSNTTGTYGLYLVTSINETDIRNNIMVGGNNAALYSISSALNTTNVAVDNNLYHTNTGSTLARWNTSNYASLSAWQAVDTTLNMNSVEGDPVFVANDDLRIIIGALANDAGDNSVGVNEDIFGTSRPFSGSTTVDIGAYEYEPLASDLELVDGMLTKGLCLSTMDTVMLDVKNVLGGTLDMSMTNIVADWTVTGPVNSNGTITVNSGSLAQDSTITLMATTVNLSVPGTYYLNAHINPSSYNLSPINDTLEQVELIVNEVWSVTPESDTLYSATDTAELKAQSPYFGGNDFFITEICQFRFNTGAPTGGWPTYFGTADDYIEITGIPGSDLSGITLEQWTTTSMVQTYTFPANTLIGPNGTAIIMVGQGASTTLEDPSNYFYYGAGSSYTWSSGTLSGRILKDAGGNIIDAVGYPGSSTAGYAFPAAAGVSTADWAGGGMGFTTTSTSGMRLEGADVNGPTNWVASATSPQDPNTVNSSVSVPVPGSISGFSWSLNGNLVDTVPVINVSHATSGIYHYVATYNHPCGPFTDTVTVYAFIAGSCAGPTNLMSTANCTDVILQWDSDQATTASFIEYGPAGFIPGNGTLKPYVTSPDTITGLTPSTAYEFYLVDSCANGVSTPVVIADSTTLTPTVADFGWTLNNVTMNNADVDFDASATTNGIDYNWDYGDGNNGTGVTPTHTYNANGTYVVTLSVTGPCVNDTHVDTIEVVGIGIDEGMIGRTMNLYPNPTNGQFRVEFEVEGLENVEISILSTIGQVVYYEKPGNISGRYTQSFDLSSEAAGVYLLRITTEEHVITRRVTLRR